MQRLGFVHAHLVDDNFSAVRKRAAEILVALRDWNARKERPFSFESSISNDVARDEQILELSVTAGIDGILIGIESPNQESLAEVKKSQNLSADLSRHVKVATNLHRAGGS